MAGMYGIFKHEYATHSVAAMDRRDDLEQGGKTRQNVTFPMLFELRNVSNDRVTHAGVQEFVADEGMCYMPYWMMQNLFLEPGEFVQVRVITLNKATYVKFQPQSKTFLDLSNPKAVLERALRGFSALTKGDTIRLVHLRKNIELRILELKGKAQFDGAEKPIKAGSIIETDVQVDFAPPIDYVEPIYEPRAQASESSTTPLSPGGTRLKVGGRSISAGLGPLQTGGKPDTKESTTDDDDSDDEDEADRPYVPFSGSGHSLSGNGKATQSKGKQQEALHRPVARNANPPNKDDKWANLGKGRSLR